MAIFWACWADLAIERSMHRNSRVVWAHFDTRATYLSCGAVCVLLNGGPSWRHGARPQPVDPPQYFSEQGFGDSDLCKLECDVATMTYDLGTELDQLLPECRQRPVLDRLRQGQCTQEVAEIVSERMELEPDLVVPEAMAGKPRPVDRMFAFLDMLLRRTSSIVELRHALGRSRIVWIRTPEFILLGYQRLFKFCERLIPLLPGHLDMDQRVTTVPAGKPLI